MAFRAFGCRFLGFDGAFGDRSFAAGLDKDLQRSSSSLSSVAAAVGLSALRCRAPTVVSRSGLCPTVRHGFFCLT